MKEFTEEEKRKEESSAIKIASNKMLTICGVAAAVLAATVTLVMVARRGEE